MRILFATSELYPYAKTGGLGDVAAALPPALEKIGIDVRVMLPGYPAVISALDGASEIIRYSIYFGALDFRILLGRLGNHTAYVLDCPEFYGRPGLYVDEGGKDYTDNHLRFAALSRAAVDIASAGDWKPDVIHANDWQGGLIAPYLRAADSRIKTVLTIHNIAYQGLFSPGIMTSIGFPSQFYHPSGAEFYDKLGYLKAGLAYADHITTVSPTYASEIQESDQGCGLEGFLQTRAGDITGIVNGIDLNVWDPGRDRDIFENYDAKNPAGKNRNKTELMKEFSLSDTERPLFGIVSRFGYQKGFDIILDSLSSLMDRGANLIVLGSGDLALEQAFISAQSAYPGRIAVHIGYNEPLAHKIIAGSDVILMPSRSEPCGLVQLYAMRYGTLPLVHRTGGLADTVIDSPDGTGFIFDSPDAESFLQSADSVLNVYKNKKAWEKRQKNAFARDSSWTTSAQGYGKVYDKVLAS